MRFSVPNSAIRLATFAPGTVFGELAILDAGPRSATVFADEDLVCLVLTMSKYTALMENIRASPREFWLQSAAS